MGTVSLTISPQHPAFAGHFPGTPIVPGALLLDEAVRALSSATHQENLHCEIAAAKFLSVVRPGEASALSTSAPLMDPFASLFLRPTAQSHPAG